MAYRLGFALAISVLAIIASSGIAAAGYIPQSYYTYYTVNSSSSFSLGVYYNVSNSSVLTIIPASEFAAYGNGGAYTTLYNSTVSSSGMDLFNLSRGDYYVILYAYSNPVSYSFYVQQGHNPKTYYASRSFNYSVYLLNYSLVNISYLGSTPLNILSQGQYVETDQNAGGLSTFANRGVYNATIIPSGSSKIYVFSSVSPSLVNPLNFTQHGLSVGLVYYGLKFDSAGISPVPVKTDELVGKATINSISAFNATPPVNSSQYGAGLQLNAMLRIISPYGNRTYWVQNVLSLNTSSMQYTYNDNVWNASSEDASVSRSTVSGSGSMLSFPTPSGVKQRIYAYQTYAKAYSLPINVTLVTSVTQKAGTPVVHFGYINGGQVTYYDNVTISVPSSSAYLLSTPYYEAGNGNPYDFELVFGGSSNGEVSYFSRMLSSISLYYESGGKLLPFPSYLTFGSDTAEGATDLTVVSSPTGALVTTGTENYNEYILPSGQYKQPAPTTSVTTSTVPSTSTSTVTSTATTTIPPPSTTVQSSSVSPTPYVSGVSVEELIAVLVILIIALLIIGVAAHKRANRGA